MNIRAEGPDKVPTDLVKYDPMDVRALIREIRIDVLENHQHLDFGNGTLVALQKTRKAKGHVKNL